MFEALYNPPELYNVVHISSEVYKSPCLTRNQKESSRVKVLGAAYKELEGKISPDLLKNKKISKNGKRGRVLSNLETLRFAIEYIKQLDEKVSTHSKSNALDASRQ